MSWKKSGDKYDPCLVYMTKTWWAEIWSITKNIFKEGDIKIDLNISGHPDADIELPPITLEDIKWFLR